jgi:hypothetical protein
LKREPALLAILAFESCVRVELNHVFLSLQQLADEETIASELSRQSIARVACVLQTVFVLRTVHHLGDRAGPFALSANRCSTFRLTVSLRSLLL